MSGICGWTGLSTSTDEQHRRIEDMAGALPTTAHGGTPPRTVTTAGSALAVTATRGPGWMHDEGPTHAAVCGRPYWSDKELATLSERRGPAYVLAMEYPRRGADILQAMHGAYALVVIRDNPSETFLAVDRLGICALSYAVSGNGLIFASTADALSRHPETPHMLRPQALYDYVYFHMIPGPLSAHVGQERLLPGHCLRFRPGNDAVPAEYWRMEYAEDTHTDFQALKQEFLELLHTSVAANAAGDEVGAFLSGGTDSSTVAGVLSRIADRPARTFSIGFDAPGYDETGYARIAARHFGTDHHEYYVTPQDVVESIPLIARSYDQPYGNASALPTYHCAQLAREHGIGRLLGGDGGDELFGGNSRYAKQYIFSLYERIPKKLRQGIIEPLFGTPTDDTGGLLHKLRRYVAQAAIPLPDRAESYNLLMHFGPSNVFAPDFLHDIVTDHPLQILRATYRNAHASNTINRLLALDLKQTLADNDLPKVTRMCELAGVEAAFPLLGEGLIEFSARLPARMKVRGTRLRYFFKKALADFLPPEILTKSKHGFGLPFGVWMNEYPPLRDLASDSLSQLRTLNIFKRDFLDSLTNRQIAEHASYYGTMIWVLMMLALWLETHPTAGYPPG
ncbi:MAG: asparagine synthase [Chromatiales bacterium 21-64-14]|nr:MAG: asparagine synthase [Chromatiales bacterium 21-64-14]